jgi:hypothetical protein
MKIKQLNKYKQLNIWIQKTDCDFKWEKHTKNIFILPRSACYTMTTDTSLTK